MKLASFEAIVRALGDAGVRYLVAGGLAVNAHGFLRFTKDADFVSRSMRNTTGRSSSRYIAPSTSGLSASGR